MEQNILYWLWLTTCRGVSSVDITALLEQFDAVEEIYKESDFLSVDGIELAAKRYKLS